MRPPPRAVAGRRRGRERFRPDGTAWYPAAMLIVDINHWLDENGQLPLEPPRLRALALGVVVLIEYGGTLTPGTMRQTLVACRRRPGRKPCGSLLWVRKTEEDTIISSCLVCGRDEVRVTGWQRTRWAKGQPQPQPLPPDWPGR